MKFKIGELLTDSSGNPCYISSLEETINDELQKIYITFMTDKFFIVDKQTGYAYNAVGYVGYAAIAGDSGWFSKKELKHYIKEGAIKRYKIL